MGLKHDDLTMLLNRLYDRGEDTFAVEHPADGIGALLRVTLAGHDGCEIEFSTSLEEDATARQASAPGIPTGFLTTSRNRTRSATLSWEAALWTRPTRTTARRLSPATATRT